MKLSTQETNIHAACGLVYVEVTKSLTTSVPVTVVSTPSTSAAILTPLIWVYFVVYIAGDAATITDNAAAADKALISFIVEMEGSA